MIGIGAMLHVLGGGSQRSSDEYAGRTITAARIEDNRLLIDFADGEKIAIFDDGQSCCEYRYMTCDDDPASLVGHQWISAEVAPGPDASADYDVHEQAFLVVKTTGGLITVANHNEHNGYYGGFGMSIVQLEPRGSAAGSPNV